MKKGFFWRGFIIRAIAFIFLIILAYNKFLVQPDISLDQIEVQGLNGNKIELADYEGKPLIINYWATWCAPCLEEFPYFNEVKQQLGSNVNFIMVSDESIERINKFSASNSYDFNYLRSDNKLSEYGINALPTTYFYNSSGILVNKHTGELDIEKLKELIGEVK